MRRVALVAAVFAVAVISAASGQTAHAETQQIPIPEPKVVVVERGDSLTKIATANATTFQRIFHANAEIADPDVIHPGQKVRIPSADEVLAERPIPANVSAPITVAAPARAATRPVAAAKVATPVKKVSTPAPAVTAASGGVWDRLAQCESGGNWSISTGNGYYGGLQFSAASWKAVGGAGLPHQASKAEQIARAEMLKAKQGWGAWPACTAKLGIR